MYLTAVEQAQSTDAAKVAEVMKSRSFDTILGKVEFDSKGDVKASAHPMFALWTVKDGKGCRRLPDAP